MPDLTPRSGLENVMAVARPADRAAFSMVLREDIALANVLVRQDSREDFRKRVRIAFELDLPNTPHRVESGPVSFAWAGPGHWLAMMQGARGHAFETQLRKEFSDLAYVTDQSDGRTIIRIGGPRARDVLAKGAPVDLHPRAFGINDAAVTVIAHVGVHLWQIDEAPTYELAVFRSYSAAFWRWLDQASAEFRV